MDTNPYQSPAVAVSGTATTRRRWIACASIGGGLFLMPTWIALVQWPPLILGYRETPGWTMNLDTMFGRISAVVGGSPMFVFVVPLAGAAIAILCSPLSRAWKMGAIIALYPMHFVQCIAIIIALYACGIDPS